MNRWFWIICCCFLSAALSGCTLLSFTPRPPQETAASPNGPKELLKKTQMEPDAAVLEIFFVRRSLGDSSINVDAWHEAIDLQIPPELRYQLNQNGFRFGQLSRTMPAGVAKLLKNPVNPDAFAPGSENRSDNSSAMASSEPPCDGTGPETTSGNENAIQVNAQSNLAKEESVVCRRLEISHRRPSEILASEIYDELTVLTHHSGGLGGETYRNAQCVFELKSALDPSGAVNLTLIPEIQYGQSRQQFSVQQGVVKLEYGRNRELFNNLKTTVSLRPGEIVILSCKPDLSGSLGSHFFSDASTKGAYQKLLIIRLAQTQHDGLFPPNGEKEYDLPSGEKGDEKRNLE